MKVEYLDPAELIPYGKNAKEYPPAQVERIANSIKRFGWQQPIVVDRNMEIIIGHCRLQAAKLLGMVEVPCLRAEDLSEEQVRELRLIDNKTNESQWDIELLTAELETVDLSGFQMDWGTSQSIDDVVEVPIPENVESNTGGGRVLVYW